MGNLTYQNKSTGELVTVRRVVSGQYVFEKDGTKIRLTRYALNKDYTFVPEKSKYRTLPIVPRRGV